VSKHHKTPQNERFFRIFWHFPKRRKQAWSILLSGSLGCLRVGGKSKIKVQKSKLQSKNDKGRQSRGAGLVLWWILAVALGGVFAWIVAISSILVLGA